jgi:hypothetical protein
VSGRPLAIDLFSGLGGWAIGLTAAGWDVIRFDLEDMCKLLGEPYPEHSSLVIQNVLTLHGSQFRDVGLIVSSSPCTEYSYMAMPWTRGKAKAADIRADETGEKLRKLNELFDAQFRIQREACEAAGHHIPMVCENVRGAQPWVGRARYNFGSYYLFGDVPALMPMTSTRTAQKGVGPAWDPATRSGMHGMTRWTNPAEGGRKVAGFRFDGSGGSFQTASVNEAMKASCGTQWFNDGPRTPDSLASSGSKSPARKAASAKIAKIPFVLSSWIGRCWLPREAAA